MTTQQPEAQERKFWKRLCALNRFSFFYMGGGVARASDKSGNWIEVHSAQEIVDDAECEVSTQHARITELESQLAQRFDAADMATAAAQGFRDGVASVSAGSESMASYAIRLLVAAALITQAKADEALRLAAEITAAHGPADGESNE